MKKRKVRKRVRVVVGEVGIYRDRGLVGKLKWLDGEGKRVGASYEWKPFGYCGKHGLGSCLCLYGDSK